MLDAERKKALSILRKYGQHATSFQTLEKHFCYFFSTQGLEESYVAFVETRTHRIVAGPCIGHPDAIVPLLQDFYQDSKQHKKKVLFFSVEKEFVEFCQAHFPRSQGIEMGVQPEWNALEFDTSERPFKKIREQVRRATNKDVEISIHQTPFALEDETSLQQDVEEILHNWKSSRKMSVMSFLVDIQPFQMKEHKVFFMAKSKNKPVGVLIAVPVFGKKGWFMEDILRVQNAPNGTIELLIVTFMGWLKKRGEGYATLGLCPLAMVPKEGNHRLFRRLLCFSYTHFRWFYHFEGLFQFKMKFNPHHLKVQYLVTLESSLGWMDWVAVLQAFSGKSFWAFVWDTLVKSWNRKKKISQSVKER